VFAAALAVLATCHRDASETAGAKGVNVKNDGGIQKQDDAEIETLVKTLNDTPDVAHADYTPSVRRLGELGLPAATAVLPLLDADDRLTRARAQRVLEQVVNRRLGWVPNRGYADPFEGQEKIRAIWEANGSYDSDAPPEARRKSIALWRQWLTKASAEDAR